MIFRENLFGCRTQRVQKPKEVISKCKHDLHLMSTELLDLRILRLKDGLELIFTESVQHFNCGEWFTARRGVTKEVPAVSFCLGSGLFGSYNSN